MDGVFCNRKSTRIYNILGLISGVFLILMFGFFLCNGEFSSLDDIIASCFIAGFGFLVSILCGVSLYVNRKANIHVDAQGITAFCHFGLSLNCGYSDVRSVSFGGTGLNIQLKNGKKYSLMYLENAYSIGRYIQRRIPGNFMAFEDVKKLTAAIPPLQKKRKYEGIGLLCCFLLLIPGILLTAALTDWKDLQDFTSADWTVFAAMGCGGVILTAVGCILLRRYLLHTEAFHNTRGALYQTLLRTAPLAPGNARKLFMDDDCYASVRLTVYGYPNSEEVYFTVEEVNSDYEMEQIHESKVYPSMEALLPEIEGMTEISLP